jgi:hypothetical protein
MAYLTGKVRGWKITEDVAAHTKRGHETPAEGKFRAAF